MDKVLKDVDWKVFQQARWFQGKDKVISEAELLDYTYLTLEDDIVLLLPLVSYIYKDGGEELYFIPLLITGEDSCEAGTSMEYCRALHDLMGEDMILPGAMGGTFSFQRNLDRPLKVRPLCLESSNTLALLRRDGVLKTRRRICPGLNHEEEVLGALQVQTDFRSIPALYGSATYRDRQGQVYGLALLISFIEHSDNGWDLMKRSFQVFLKDGLLDALEDAEAMGRAICRMHMALESLQGPSFQPEPLLKQDVKDMLYKMERDYERLLITGLSLPPMDELRHVIEGFLLSVPEPLGKKMWIHGDLHLGNILKGSEGFAVIDFEGQVLKGEESAGKASPLRDVAGMLRSFDYASWVALGEIRDSSDGLALVRRSGLREKWVRQMSIAFLRGYLQAYGKSEDAQDPERLLLTLFKLEKALYEVKYEMRNRPEWVFIPAIGVMDILNELKEQVPYKGG